ncbi:MAG: hypothetical protein IJQ83_00030 [Bacteroidales bacterium]|nr:hypothetical protein [Bacteroidales bacterium]
MKAYDLIQVLWVEDDPKVIETYPSEAEISAGLQLVDYRCWDDAKAALENDYDRWSAIILDAKCKQHRESADNAVKFLGEALKDIAKIGVERRRIIPWYVLTAGAESEVSDSITDDRMLWDADWTNDKKKNHYSKNEDRRILFERIKIHAQKSSRIQIQEQYRDIYKQLVQLNTDVCEDILTILAAIHFPNIHPDFNPKYFYNPLRKALECVFRSMQKAYIIPDVFFTNGLVNLNQCFMFVIGKEAVKLGYKHGGGGITPRHIQDMMSLIINLGNTNSHSIDSSHPTELNDEEIQNYDNQMQSIGGNSKLLIFSIALQFCEILQWMNSFIKNHPDLEENRKKWVKLDKIDSAPEEIDDDNNIGTVEIHNGIYHIGEEYLLNGKTIEQRGWLGKKVKILGKDINKTPSAKQYPFFAYKIEPIE